MTGKEAYRSGFIAILGRPNVGKSTLLNSLVQYELAITSPKPQTTRSRILGIKSIPGAQMIFVDTPGIGQIPRTFNRYMVSEALRALQDVDLVLIIVEANDPAPDENQLLLKNLNAVHVPVILVINKIDLVEKPSLLRLMEQFDRQYAFDAIVPLSALEGDGVDLLEQEILQRLNPGPQYFPDDQITDLTERFLAGEVIREKVFRLCGEEIPYSTAVVVEDYQERNHPKPVYISATVYVEKKSQKGILIGAGGSMLKRIGKAAREDLEQRLGRPIYLDLWVKVEKNWTRNEKALRRMGYK